MKFLSLLLFVLSVGASEEAIHGASSSVIITSAERTLDLSSQLAKITLKLTAEKASSSEAVKSLLFSVSPKLESSVTFVQVTETGVSAKSKTTTTKELRTSKSDGGFWKAELQSPLKSEGDSVSIVVDLILGRSALEMLPKEILQKEAQFVRFIESHYIYVPYKVRRQTTKISFPNSNVESYSKLKPVALSDSTLSYGPYVDVEPLELHEMSLHYENNNPFLVINRMTRLIEISMWGNIAVEETMDVRHAGAKLKGSFSRYDFQREHSASIAAVKSFKTYLPAAAVDVYYRDEVGNISTSSLRTMDDAVEVNLQPRFPLFGGWKTHYTIGYNVPSYEYLYVKGNTYVLNMRLLDHVFNDMLVEDFKILIILPEGANVMKVHTPYAMNRGKDELHYTYLDTVGRPVITLTNVGNLVEKHIQDLQIEFTFSRLLMLREPLLLIGAFLLFFILAMIYVRLDFSISKDKGYEARMKLAGYSGKTANAQDRRARCYTQVDDALAKFKSSKDPTAFQNSIKKVNVDHKNETAIISDLNTTIKQLAPDVGEKISELQRLDKMFREQQIQQSTLVEKLVSGKLTKQQFIDQESVIVKKKDEHIEKINGIVRTL